MADYKNMYLELFNGVTAAVDILQRAQLAAEDIYISGSDTELTVLETSRQDDSEE